MNRKIEGRKYHSANSANKDINGEHKYQTLAPYGLGVGNTDLKMI